jgi:hypothetical protein
MTGLTGEPHLSADGREGEGGVGRRGRSGPQALLGQARPVGRKRREGREGGPRGKKKRREESGSRGPDGDGWVLGFGLGLSFFLFSNPF